MPASIRDVAQRAGVSVGTVSNVLNRPEEVSLDSVDRVNRAIEELGYVRNDAARKLRGGVSSTVGFVVLDGQNPFYTDVVRGAEDEGTRHNIAILYGNTDEDHAREKVYLDLFEEQQVRGVLIAPYGDITARLQRLRARGIAAVLVDRFSGDGRFSSVSVDSVARRPDGGRAPDRDRPQAHRLRRRPLRHPPGERPPGRRASRRGEREPAGRDRGRSPRGR